MRLIVDRFEGRYAVCEQEDRTMVNIEKSKLPKGTKEGDVLIMDEDSISLDHVQTDQRKSDVKKLMDELWESK